MCRSWRGQPAKGLDHIDCLEWELQTLSHSGHKQLQLPTHTDTLCTTQKQTNLTNPLLQDFAVFNKHDSTKLEEWLTDIETAVDLTCES